jgi:FkbM family methyltransferase
MIVKIKEWIKAKLKKALLVPEPEEIKKLNLFGMAPWYQENFWEPPVQLALRDLCQHGDIVFDVGANFAGLTTVMSRMVGPKGVVCAFEASPRIIGKCQHNLVLNGCHNVQLYHAAIYSQSYQEIPIYLGSHLNDSIYSFNSDEIPAYKVSSIALDDFVSKTGLVPNLVKMDIEGAEFDAVKGMLNTIARAKPHLILETQPHDTNCLNLLTEQGYVAIDLNSYREIKTPQDYPLGVELRNNLYIHQEKLSKTPYQPPFHLVEYITLNSEDFYQKSHNLIELQKPLNLQQGRYLIDVDFVAQGRDNEMICGVKLKEKVIFRYHSYSNFLASSYRDWVIHLVRNSEVNLYFEFLNDTFDPTFSVQGAKLYRVKEFDNLPPPLFI